MLFWIFVIVLCIGLMFLYIDSYINSHYYNIFGLNNESHTKLHKLWKTELFSIGGAILVFVGILTVSFSLFAIIGYHTNAEPYIAQTNERYEALCYKLETENARDEFGLLNKEIIDEIQEWNEEIAKYQSLQDNFWLGIYYPNIYDQFEKIPLK